ncbi:MAG: low-specificity L-threonine aldolase [Pseudomonadota bacterium]
MDLRSDTVTRPTQAMREAMMLAETGDDVYGEDPTVNELEQFAAQLTGKQAAVFATSGTQSNLMALLSHCHRGHEYIVGQGAHTYLYEAGGAAVLGGIQPYTLPLQQDGSLSLTDVEQAIKPDDEHYAITRLICLENTQGGKVLSLDYLRQYAELAQKYNLARHLDGARVFNAAVALDSPVEAICQHFDTVSFCLSKGLACPVGSVLVGDADVIARARRWRKMLGGGMRQAGMLAAAGLYALKNHVQRLVEDHEKAVIVAERLNDSPNIHLSEQPQTNMVMLSTDMNVPGLEEHLLRNGIRTSGTRWVFHQDVTMNDVEYLLSVCEQFRAR